MARIISLSVNGLAGREGTYSVRLQEDVNVFFGINGSGKTTLLKILHSALSTETSILEGLPFQSAEVEVYLNRFESVFKRRAQKPDRTTETAEAQRERLRRSLTFRALSGMGGRGEPPEWDWTSEPEEPEGRGLTPYRGGYLPITRLYRTVGTQTSGAKSMSEDELDARFAAEVQRRWTDYQGEVSTKISEVQGKGLANILHLVLSGEDEVVEYDTSLEISDAYERVAAFLRRQAGFEDVLDSRQDFENKYRTRPRIKSVVKQIDLVERQIEGINAPRQRFQRLLESMYGGSKRIVFSEKEISVELADKAKIHLPSLSSGEKQLFFIALEAIRSSNHALIIDEPELSMHVDWQKSWLPHFVN